MKQPELGKKIAELRKAKGLTQEELVEKCNLNVRTLQRIESGEVTPRSYTIKTIFTVLDFTIYDSSEPTHNFSWLEQYYKYLIDLFNLKTNTMKKITILSIMLSAILLGLFVLNTESQAQNKNNLGSKHSSKPSSNGEIVFSNFSCANCFEDNDDLIGSDVKFKTNGVTIKIGLIKLNKKTREFKAGIVKGKILQNRIDLFCPKDILNDNSVKYTADKIEQSADKILLKGNAKLSSIQNDTMEADEIVIATY